MRAARGLLLAFAAFGAYWGAWGVLVPDVKEQVDASVTELGIAFLALALAALPAMLVTGRIVDRVGPRILPLTLVLFGLAAVLPGLAGSVWQLTLALILVGITTGAVDVVINVAATNVETSGGPRVMQVAHALFSAGFLVAAVAVGIARGAGAGALPVLAGIGLLVLVSAAFNRGYPTAPRRDAPRRIVLSHRLLVLGLLCGLAFMIEGGIENWSALYLETDLDASPTVSGLGPGAFAAAMVGGRLLGQWLELLGFAIGGAGVSVAAPTLFGAAGRGASEAERGSAVASVTTISYLGFLVGPPLIGAVSGATDLRVGIGLLAGISCVLAVTAAAARRALPDGGARHP